MSEHDKKMLEDTDSIQKAIEEVVDHETAALPILPVLEDEMPPDEDEVEDIDDEADIFHYSDEDTGLHRWFFTFMCMNIPVVGWIYLLYLAFNKKKRDRRSFARAYLFYKLLFLVISGVILAILLYFGLQLLDQVLAYMEML